MRKRLPTRQFRLFRGLRHQKHGVVQDPREVERQDVVWEEESLVEDKKIWKEEEEVLKHLNFDETDKSAPHVSATLRRIQIIYFVIWMKPILMLRFKGNVAANKCFKTKF